MPMTKKNTWTVELDDGALASLQALQSWLRGFYAGQAGKDPKQINNGPPWEGIAVLDALTDPQITQVSTTRGKMSGGL